MANTYSLGGTYQLSYQVNYQETTGNNVVPDNLRTGTGKFSNVNNTLQNGSGAGQALYSWHDNRTVNAGINDDLVLTGGTLKDAFGNVLAFTSVKWVLIRIVSPATGNRLLVGNHPTNAVPLWMSAGNVTTEVRSVLFQENQIDGWAVGGAQTTLRINNPSAGSVTYDISIVGN